MKVIILLAALLLLAGSVYQWLHSRKKNGSSADRIMILCGAALVVFSIAAIAAGGETGLPFWATAIAAILVGACGGIMFYNARNHRNVRHLLLLVTALLVVMTLISLVSSVRTRYAAEQTAQAQAAQLETDRRANVAKQYAELAVRLDCALTEEQISRKSLSYEAGDTKFSIGFIYQSEDGIEHTYAYQLQVDDDYTVSTLTQGESVAGLEFSDTDGDGKLDSFKQTKTE